MVTYNPKDWINLIFAFHRSDTFRILLPSILGLGLITLVVVTVEMEVAPGLFTGTEQVHALLGFVISLLLVFRTNTAYDRWWEGRKLWGGLVNNTRNLSIKLNGFLPKEEHGLRNYFFTLISNYCFASRDHLRELPADADLTFNETFNPGMLHKEDGAKFKHIPNRLAMLMFEKLQSLHANKIISGEQFYILNAEFQYFTDFIGACERIKYTPIPFSYSLFIKKFIFLYVITMPFGFVYDFGYWTIPIVMLVFYILASIELIAEEIEDPFGMDDNDLPSDELSKKIEANIKEILL